MDILDTLATRLADRYAVEREIGRGGMATVYLARDLRHDRMVAVKVLNPELGAVLGAERFLSEIRVTAGLQHPNLLPLFDSGEVDGLLYYVMPYVDGESLRERLSRERQLPIDEAVRIAVAVAGALDYAHRRGVIHRDLKPENILLHDGQPLIADFGIALAVSNAGGARITQTGLSLGTPQYMSPEQATGDRVIDSRTDIYSLGAVTYEMLAGEPPHIGNTAQAIIARLMTEEPRPLSSVRKAVPPNVESAVGCALEKLPADRFASAGIFAQAMMDGSLPHHTQHSRAAFAPGPRSRTMLAALPLAIVAAVVFAVLWVRASRPDSRVLTFVLDLPASQQVVTSGVSAVALSPDGGTIAYTARTFTSLTVQTFVRRLDSLRARPTPINGYAPHFTPDGKWLLYLDYPSLRRMPVDGGSSESIVKLDSWQGYGIGPRGDIVIAADGTLWRVGLDGSKTRIIAPDTLRHEASLASPTFLDDKTIAYWIQRSDDATGNGVGITTLDGGEHSVLNLTGNKAFGMLDGHLLIGSQEGSLQAYPFNLRRREVTGPPVMLLDSIVWIVMGGLQLSIANEGSLAYLRGSSRRSLALVDKFGRILAEAPEKEEYRHAALSPDGKRVAVAIARNVTGGRNVATSDIWLWDTDTKSLARFTTDGGFRPKWSADGKRIAFLQATDPRHSRVMWAVACSI